MRTATLDSPVGPLAISCDGEAIVGVHFGAGPTDAGAGGDAILDAARRQLDDYFAGRRDAFDLPLAPRGTPFQRRVWDELAKIPFGQTISYLELARRVGNANACRAVGAANGRNPIAIVIPCHRVIAADGQLGGFGGGLEAKRTLLTLEATARAR